MRGGVKTQRQRNNGRSDDCGASGALRARHDKGVELVALDGADHAALIGPGKILLVLHPEADVGVVVA